jgi:hypothetical protein
LVRLEEGPRRQDHLRAGIARLCHREFALALGRCESRTPSEASVRASKSWRPVFWLWRTLAEFANQGNKFHLPFYPGPLAEIDTEGTRREDFPAGEFCVWALGSMKPDSIARGVDWCTKARSYMPLRRSALEAGKAAFDSGFLKTFTDEIYPGRNLSRRGSGARMPPLAYKAISDAIQSCQLNGQNPEDAAAAASEQIDAFLASYNINIFITNIRSQYQ